MRRLKFSAAALTAVIAVALSASSAASAQNLPVHLFDSFNGTNLNPAMWGFAGVPDPGTTQTVHDGSWWLTASSTAAQGFNIGSVLAGCQVVGDFDAQMQFTLSTWPAGDNVTLAISAYPIGNTFVNSQSTGDVWGLFVPQTTGTGYGYTQFPALVTSGSLRMIRRGDEISSYFRTDQSRNWQRISGFIGSTVPTFLGVSIWNTSGPFGGQPASVAVHSFKLEAAGLTGLGGYPCLL